MKSKLKTQQEILNTEYEELESILKYPEATCMQFDFDKSSVCLPKLQPF